MRIVLIAGLPGSGKTMLASTYEGFRVIDDIRSFADLAGAIDAGVNVVVTDPNFCSRDARERAVKMIGRHADTTNIEWVFFENAPDKCRANVNRRKERGDLREVEGTIRRFSKQYEIPTNAIVIPVWEPTSK